MSELIRRAMVPFLPVEARYRLRQQRIDVDASRVALRVLDLDGVSARVIRSTPGTSGTSGTSGTRSAAAMTLVPTRSGPYRPGWLGDGILRWDGTLLTVSGDTGVACHWQPQDGGLKPGFGAEVVSEAGRRPVSSGECPATFVEIAAVALKGSPPRRLYLLDEESHHLAMLPTLGLAEEELAALASRAGVDFRVYSLAAGDPFTPMEQVSPDVLCEVLFPRSARRRRLLSPFSDAVDWWTPVGIR